MGLGEREGFHASSCVSVISAVLHVHLQIGEMGVLVVGFASSCSRQ